MTARLNAELTTFEWIHLTPKQLRARRPNFKPLDRVLYTGHLNNLQSHWAVSVGNWGGPSYSALINAKDPSKGVLRVRPAAYRQFKNRYRLYDGPQFQQIHGTGDWLRAELSYCEYKRAQVELFAVNGCYAPIGSACRHAVQTATGPDTSWRLGLLAVEVVLWTRVFAAFLDHYALSYEAWWGMSDAEKTKFWDNPRDDKRPWHTTLFRDSPAILTLPEHVLAATG